MFSSGLSPGDVLGVVPASANAVVPEHLGLRLPQRKKCCCVRSPCFLSIRLRWILDLFGCVIISAPTLNSVSPVFLARMKVGLLGGEPLSLDCEVVCDFCRSHSDCKHHTLLEAEQHFVSAGQN